jgi:transcriptional accessory protein Tex/SPT6
MNYLERIEAEDRRLGGTVRQDEWTKLRYRDHWMCSDYRDYSNWEKALKHEKSINVLARHRGAVPQKVRTWITTDDKEFPSRDLIGRIIAIEYQTKLDQRNKCKEIAKALWKRGQSPIETEEQLAELLMKRHKALIEAVGVFMPQMH